MQKITVSVKKIHPLAVLPVYATAMSSMADLSAFVHDDSEEVYGVITIEPGQTKMVRTGLSLRPAPGYATKVYPRSGLAAKLSVTLQNAVGVIDHDYPDELRLLVRNEGGNPFVVESGMRIAQLEVHPVVQGHFQEVEELPEVQLNAGEVARTGGFGHTGTHAISESADEAVAVADPCVERSLAIGRAMQSFGDFLMECNITSTTGVTHNACEEVGSVLRALGDNIASGHAVAVTHDVEFSHHVAQATIEKLQQL